MLYYMIVAFCGHNDVANPDDVRRWLEHTVGDLIQRGATTFYLGGYGGFDRLAASILHKVSAANPSIESILVLPYLNRDAEEDLYDGTIYPPLENVPKRLAIIKRNEWMVDHADVIVAYVLHDWGGASAMLQYAIRKEKEIIRYSSYS
jgi:uncharacterized phage-like protein YoqJ